VIEVPIKLYRTPDRLTVAAPMPGLLAEDFSIEITSDNRLVLRGAVRGATADIQLFHRLVPSVSSKDAPPTIVEETRELLIDEWTAGSYRREVDLPSPVDGTLATATYGNGILVVTLPVADRVVAARLELEAVGIGRAERVGSAGHPIQPRSTAEHVQAAHGSRQPPWQPIQASP
jgi:HSP20 family protein